MLLETQSDSTADSIKSVGSELKQGSDAVDSTEEVLYWVRASKDNLLMKSLKEMTGLMVHTMEDYARDTEKQIKKLKKF